MPFTGKLTTVEFTKKNSQVLKIYLLESKVEGHHQDLI